jgi:ubiquinone/menaquinone biosynthesis C-methylase UbiE
MTDELRARAARLRGDAAHIRFVSGRLEDLPFDDGAFDVEISNGVVNLCPQTARVFAEAARVLAPGGLHIDTLHEVQEYQFLTIQAQNASRTFGVRALTLAAHKI